MTNPHEPLLNLFSQSTLLVLDFSQIPVDTPENQSIAAYFNNMDVKGKDPRLPASRQAFHNTVAALKNVRYLVSRYGEDRAEMLKGSQIAKEHRTIHLGIDIFCQELEEVYAPFSGKVVRIDKEEGRHTFGNFIIIKPEDSEIPYIYLAHLANQPYINERALVKAGDKLSKLGDYHGDENGYWSRHLHIQMLKNLPEPGFTPPGYSTPSNFTKDRLLYPDPMTYFPDWHF